MNDATLPVDAETAQKHAMAIMRQIIRRTGIDWTPTSDDGWEAVSEWYLQRAEGTSGEFGLHEVCGKIVRRKGQPLSTRPCMLAAEESIDERDFEDHRAEHTTEVIAVAKEALPDRLQPVLAGILELSAKHAAKGGALDVDKRLQEVGEGRGRWQALERLLGTTKSALEPLLFDLWVLARLSYVELEEDVEAAFKDHGQDASETWSMPFTLTDEPAPTVGTAAPDDREHCGYVTIRKHGTKRRIATMVDRSEPVDITAESSVASEVDWSPKPSKAKLAHWTSDDGWLVVADWSI